MTGLSALVSAIPIIEVIFIILLIKEIFGIGYKKAGSNKEAGDLATAWANKAFAPSNKQAENNIAEEKIVDNDLKKATAEEKEDTTKAAEAQKLINSLAIEGDNNIAKLNSGMVQLEKNKTANYFADNAMNLHVKIVQPMIVVADAEKGNLPRLQQYTLDQIAIMRNILKGIEDEEKLHDKRLKVRKNSEATLAKLLSETQSGITKKEDELASANIAKLAKKKINQINAELDALVKQKKLVEDRLKAEQNWLTKNEQAIKVATAQFEKISSDMKRVGIPDENKLIQLERNAIQELNAIITELKGISNCLANLHKMKSDAAVTVEKLSAEKLKNYDNKLPELKAHLDKLTAEQRAMSVLIIEINKQVKDLQIMMGNVGPSLNDSNQLNSNVKGPENGKGSGGKGGINWEGLVDKS